MPSTPTPPAVLATGSLTVDGRPAPCPPPVTPPSLPSSISYNVPGYYAPGPAQSPLCEYCGIPPAPYGSQYPFLMASNWIDFGCPWAGGMTIAGAATMTWNFFDAGQKTRNDNAPPSQYIYNCGPNLYWDIRLHSGSDPYTHYAQPTYRGSYTSGAWSPNHGGPHGPVTSPATLTSNNVSGDIGGQFYGSYDLYLIIDLSTQPTGVDYPGYNYTGASLPFPHSTLGTVYSNEGYNFAGDVTSLSYSHFSGAYLPKLDVPFSVASSPIDATGYDEIEFGVYHVAANPGPITGHFTTELQSLGPDGNWYRMHDPGSISSLNPLRRDYCWRPSGGAYAPGHTNTLRVVATNNSDSGPGTTPFGNYPASFDWWVSGASLDVATALGPPRAPTLLASGAEHAVADGDTTLTPFSADGYDYLILLVIPDPASPDAFQVSVVTQFLDGTWNLLNGDLYVYFWPYTPQFSLIGPDRFESADFSGGNRAISWQFLGSGSSIVFQWWVFGQPMGLL